MGKACGVHWREAECIKDFDGKSRGRRPLGRTRRRWEDNVKIVLRDIGCGKMDRIDLAQEGSCEHGNKPSGPIKC
jgi:hypothetical protein